MSKYVGFQLGKVHESHVISEYYCGGCGWPVTDHDSFCPECGGAFRECDASDLDAENAKLKADVERMFNANVEKNNEILGLLAENAKLRELATYALRYIVEVWCDGEGRDLFRGKPCEDCVDAGSSDCPKCMPRMFDVSGIEVDA